MGQSPCWPEAAARAPPASGISGGYSAMGGGVLGGDIPGGEILRVLRGGDEDIYG